MPKLSSNRRSEVDKKQTPAVGMIPALAGQAASE